MITRRSATELEVLRTQVIPAYAEEGLDVDLSEELWAITASIDGGVLMLLLLQVNALALNVLGGPAWDLLERSASGRPIVIQDRCTARRLTVLPDQGLPREAMRTPLPGYVNIVWDHVGGRWKSVDI